MENTSNQSEREERIRKITLMYYSRPEIQKAIFEFSQNREIIPRYFEGFGKRPDSIQYPSEIFELARKGATSFHCSEELWKDPLKISTDMNEKQLDELRIGWDLLIDIDSKYLDYSKVMAELVIKMLNFHGVKNIGIKFSGSKGFHIIVPWQAFPEEVNGVKTSEMFPKYPRIIVRYLKEKIQEELTERINQLNYSDLYPIASKYIKREKGSKDIIKGIGENKAREGNYIIDAREKVNIDKKFENIMEDEESWNKEAIPDLILVSSRHLFRAPYSLHEKTALASAVLESNPDKIKNFSPKDADPMKITIKNFIPEAVNGEASRLLMQALDWYKVNNLDEETGEYNRKAKSESFKPIKIEKISDDFLPPSIKKMLEGLSDGRKRALFVLINLFRSIGMERDELEKRIYEWNRKNAVPLKDGYIKSQVVWSYRNKIVPPPNYDKDYYKGIGVVPSAEELKMKNPVNYVVRKDFARKMAEKKTNESMGNAGKKKRKRD